MQISIQQINHTHHFYSGVWQVREDVLRKPLGLSLVNEDLGRDAINEIFIALNNEIVIGCVLMQPLSEHEIQLRAMAVYNDWQGKGIGKMLVQAAERFSKTNGFNKITLHARKVAIGFYENMGYIITSGEFTEVGISHYMMEKVLH